MIFNVDMVPSALKAKLPLDPTILAGSTAFQFIVNTPLGAAAVAPAVIDDLATTFMPSPVTNQDLLQMEQLQ